MQTKQRTRCAEKDDRPWDIVLLEGCSQRERDTDACHRDEVVPARVADPRQCVHFGIHANGASPDDATALEFGAPGRGKAEVMPGYGKAT